MQSFHVYETEHGRPRKSRGLVEGIDRHAVLLLRISEGGVRIEEVSREAKPVQRTTAASRRTAAERGKRERVHRYLAAWIEPAAAG
jgi:hypothetical protein